MIIENYHDPTESLFNEISKIIAKNGVGSERIQGRIQHLLNLKLNSELTFAEF